MMMFLTQKLLAVEVAGDDLRAAVVSKNGKKFEILDFTSLKWPDPDDDLPAIDLIRAMADRLSYSGGQAVYVTPLARAFELFMDRNKVSQMKRYQLMEAVKWEVEPYTGISGTNALIGVEKEKKKEVKAGEIIVEDDDEMTVNVSAMERNVYRAIKERFRAAGLSLVRIYPPDVCFFMPLFMEAVESPRALLEVGQDYSNFAIIRGKHPEQINTINISLESIAAHLDGESVSKELEDTLKFTVRQTPNPEPLILSGPGAGNPEVVDYISGFCPNGAKPLVLSKAASLTDSGVDASNAAFGTVVGAAVRNLKGQKERRIGIDDTEPLVPKLKKSAYMMPLVMTSLLLIVLFGHYQYMKYQDRIYKARIKELSSELKKRKAAASRYESILKESGDLKKEIDFAERKIAYATGRADEDIENVINCLKGFAGDMPENIVLEFIHQDSSNHYIITGFSYDLKSVGSYATRMQKNKWCDSVVINSLEQSDSETGKLNFEFSVKTTNPAA